MKTLIEYAKSLIGKPYIWGGEGPIGFDCSGLVQEILRSVGIDPPGDQSAQALYNHFKDDSFDGVRDPGALAFYGKSVNEISHVAFFIDNWRIIEAGGGGSSCKTPESAAIHNAMTRIRPYNHRRDLVAILLPEYVNCTKE